MKKRYGITEETYIEMLAEQSGRCAICKRTAPYRLYIDHNHRTHEVRGLLCAPCNTGLGYIERRGFLEAAIVYLKG